MSLALFLFLAATTAGSPAASIRLTPCHVRQVKQELLCGSMEVYEDRAAQRGRKIALHIVVMPATGKHSEPDPLFSFSGGPGEAATNDIELIVHDWGEINEHRDIVLVDVRGTGESNGLQCREKERTGTVQSMLESFYSVRDLSQCRKNLETHADLRFYNTSLAVDDLDEVRAALGYKTINIFGGSYGTRVVLVYLQKHPEVVRTATLWDPVSTDARMPLYMAADAQAALDGLIEACRKDAKCHAAFPDTSGELSELLKQTEAKPVTVQAEDALTKKKVRFVLSRAGVVQTVRYMLYSPKTAVQIPLQIHLATNGNWELLAQTAYDYAGQISGAISQGYYLSTTCTEDVPFYTMQEAEKAAQNTFVGNFRARVQKEACEKWPRMNVDPSFLESVHSDVPSLLIQGELDPVTPPHFSREISSTLMRPRTLLVPRGSHDFEGMENSHCIDRIITDFLNKGDEKKIDASCLSTMQAPPFALSEK